MEVYLRCTQYLIEDDFSKIRFFLSEASTDAILGDFDTACEKLLETGVFPDEGKEQELLLKEIRQIVETEVKRRGQLARVKRDRAHLRKVIRDKNSELKEMNSQIEKSNKKVNSSSRKITTLKVKCASLL